MTKRYICAVLGHRYVVERVLNYGSRKIGCKRCNRHWGMNDATRSLVDWDGELESFYADNGLLGDGRQNNPNRYSAIKVLADRELLADLVGSDHDKRINAERSLYATLANAQPAHDVASVPDGFVMVPAEPTDAMKLAGNDALAQHWGAGDAYRAMLAASRLPVQPVQGMSNRSKRLDEIRAEAERFFEWPGDDRSTVTLTSCILFADHIAAPSAQAAPKGGE